VGGYNWWAGIGGRRVWVAVGGGQVQGGWRVDGVCEGLGGVWEPEFSFFFL
jgi:hypothetical protein